MSTQRILLISNGYAEDLIGAELATRFQKVYPKVEITAFPLVGAGTPYGERGIPIGVPTRTLPSGGFARQSLGAFARDLQAGWLGLTAVQCRKLREARLGGGLAIAVGDLYPVLLAVSAGLRPVVLVATAKSSYIRGHLRIECALMRRWCSRVFCRDERTALDLRRERVPADFMGNPVMDILPAEPVPIPVLPGALPLAVLPGSREDAGMNLQLLLQAADLVRKRGWPVDVLVALADTTPTDRLESTLPAEWSADSRVEGRDPLELARFRADNPTGRVRFFRRRLRDVVESSRLVLGMAGTANEQAAGLGRPVVAIPGEGVQFTPAFARMQKRLLGEALHLSQNPQGAATAIVEILEDEVRYKLMVAAGRKRMGEAGALDRIVGALLQR